MLFVNISNVERLFRVDLISICDIQTVNASTYFVGVLFLWLRQNDHFEMLCVLISLLFIIFEYIFFSVFRHNVVFKEFIIACKMA